MHFKRLLLIPIFFSMVSCSNYIHGEDRDPQVIDISGGRFSCLKNLSPALTHALVGEGVPSEITLSFQCLGEALFYFQERTIGSYDDAYSGEDFRKFFGKYFLKTNNIPSTLAQQLVLLKAALIGGASDRITRTEVRQISQILGIVRDEIIFLIPHFKILMVKTESATGAQIDAATAALQESLARLVAKSSLKDSKYQFPDLKNLFGETLIYFRTSMDTDRHKKLEDFIPLADAVKKILLGSDAEFKSLEDWRAGITSLVELANLGLRFHYLVPALPLVDATATAPLANFIERTLNLLRDSYQMKKRGFIPAPLIDELIESFAPGPVAKLPHGISKSAAFESYRLILGKIKAGNDFKTPAEFTSLQKEHLEAVRQEVRVWQSLQTFVDTAAPDPKGPVAWENLVSVAQAYDFEKSTMTLFQDRNNDLDLKIAWEDWQLVLQKPLRQNYVDGGAILIPSSAASQTRWGLLTRSNLMYMVTRFLLKTYGTGAAQIQKATLSEAQLVQWYADFRPLGLDLKAFDSRELNSGKRSFKEANFFMTHSNGDGHLDFRELYQYVSVIISAGMGTVSDARAALMAEKCAVDKLDPFQLPMFEEGCFRRALTEKYPEIFKNLPRFVKYFKANPDRWKEYLNQILAVARTSDPKGGLVEHADIRTFVMMTHYTELLMSVFDANGDDFLDRKECSVAYLRFRSFLLQNVQIPGVIRGFEKVILRDPEILPRNAFIYLTMYGKKPEGGDWVKYLLKVVGEPWADEKMTADRLSLAKVFGYFKQGLKKE